VNSSHSRWRTRRDLLNTGDDLDPEARAVYEETRLAGQIAQAIYDRRTALGLSQSELAKRAGMTQPAINRLETGTTLPSSRTLFRIARALDAGLVVAFDTHLTDAA
jgi:ribosome-binding protein aMBF1 (putative translation factor)